MHRIPVFLAILSAAALFPIGCSSLLVSSVPPPKYFQLDYSPDSVSCEHRFNEGVTIWNFTSSSPYDQPDMVVLKNGNQAVFSSSYQWVATPGTMVAEKLLRDMSSGGPFPQAVDADNPLALPMTMTGRIFTFAWEENGSESRAVLQAEVDLMKSDNRTILFRKKYSLRSEPRKTKEDPEAFAALMSSLVRDFSRRVRRDLCETAAKQAG